MHSIGEEHLRMFRRMTQEREAVPRVAVPKEAVGTAKASLSDAKVTYQEAEGTARRLGGRLATLTEFIMDRRLTERVTENFVFIDWRGKAPKKGEYRIDLAKRELVPISFEEENKGLEWREKLFIDKNALEAIKERRLLAVYAFYGFWLGVYGGYNEGGVARIVFVKEK